MYQQRRRWIIGVITLVLSMAACQRAEEPTLPAKETPAATQPAQAKKVVAPAPLKEFLQEINTSAPLRTMKVGEKVTIPVTVKNTGKETWSATPNAAGLNLVLLGYRWLDKSGKVLTGEALSGLPHDLEPGQSMSLNATIQAPAEARDYISRLTMVQHGVAWFDDRGGQPLDIPVTVTAQ